MITIGATEYDNHNNHSNNRTTISVDRFPDACPFCHQGIAPKAFGTAYLDDKGAQIILFCPNRSCKKIFVGYFTHSVSNGHWALRGISQGTPKTVELPEVITGISLNFATIYQQSSIAEQQGLLAICGVGYRKSLEFLIKDYVISKHPGEADEIKKKFLGNCIKEYVADQRIKTVAERATWLGNDETHYVRKWETKDMNDLKALIRITMLWIEMEIETERIEAEMPTPS